MKEDSGFGRFSEFPAVFFIIVLLLFNWPFFIEPSRMDYSFTYFYIMGLWALVVGGLFLMSRMIRSHEADKNEKKD